MSRSLPDFLKILVTQTQGCHSNVVSALSPSRLPLIYQISNH